MMHSYSDFWGDACYQEMLDAGWEGLQRAVVYYWNRLQEAVNVSAKIGKGTKASDYQASKPGEPPRKRTGWLQKSVLYELDKAAMTGRVGVTRAALYGLFLELGTKRMKARPWLLATLKKYFAQIQAQAGPPTGAP